MKKIFLIFVLPLYGISVCPAQDQKINRLSERIVKGIEDDSLKVRAIYKWVCKKIKYDYKRYYSGDYPNPNVRTTLRRRKAVCAGFALLFKALCNSQDIEAEYVPGYSKGGEYDPDFPLRLDEHAWNAVMINQKWYLVDISWSNSKLVRKWIPIKNLIRLCKGLEIEHEYRIAHRPNDKYYLLDPAKMIRNHLPLMPMWQLLHQQTSIDEFTGNAKNDSSSAITHKQIIGEEIQYYRQLEFKDQLLWEAEAGYGFNPLNHRIIGYNYVKYAILDTIETDTIDYRKEGIKYVKEAIKDNQREHQQRTARNQERKRQGLAVLKKTKSIQKKLLRAWTKHRNLSIKQIDLLKGIRKQSPKDIKLQQTRSRNQDRPLSQKQKLALEARLEKLNALNESIIDQEFAIQFMLDSISILQDYLIELQFESNKQKDQLITLSTDLANSASESNLDWDSEQVARENLHQYWVQTSLLEAQYQEFEKQLLQYFRSWQRAQKQLLNLHKTKIRQLEQINRWAKPDAPSQSLISEAVSSYYLCQNASSRELEIIYDSWKYLRRNQSKNRRFARIINRMIKHGQKQELGRYKAVKSKEEKRYSKEARQHQSVLRLAKKSSSKK